MTVLYLWTPVLSGDMHIVSSDKESNSEDPQMGTLPSQHKVTIALGSLGHETI
jgi:hypothetical protein